MSVYRILAEDAAGFRKRPCAGADEVAELQDRRLRRVVAHACRAVPYYKRLFAEARLDPRDIRGVRDLPLIPISAKEALQSLPLGERVAEGVNPARLVRHSTSGSTGMPMVVLRTRLEEALVHGYQLRSQLLFGAPLRARRAKIGKTYRAGLVHRLGLLPTIQIDAPARTPASILEELRRWRPDCIDVRPGVLDPLTEEAERQGRGDWPWRWIVCGGEVLYPDLLERAERAFGARILERYGAHEAGQIAWRCLDCGCMHTNDDSVVVEVEKDGRTALPGETGEVLVTSLLSFAMPFIRLRLGDLAERGSDQNPCRFGFARIGSVQGRRIDNLALADGRSIPAYGLMAAVRRAAGVRRFQIIQESFDEVRVLYVPADGSSADLGGEVERLLRPALPAAMNITAECVSDIPLAESGKYRSVRSLPAQPRPSSHTPK